VRIATVILLMLGVLVSVPLDVDAQVRVRGYVRRDGTYVPPHVRSSPDGNPSNNWSYPGNVNPYTGKIATGDPLTYLERYYRTKSSASTAARSVGLPAELTANLAPLPGVVPLEEIDRARSYCRDLSMTVGEFDNCLARQTYALAGLALPDYGSIPKDELTRGGKYCEGLYGDDRAGFYNCFNRQVLGLSAPGADLSAASSADRARATRYCASLYGDDRAGNANCLRRQAGGIPASAPESPTNIPASEWQRSIRYCESLYGDDRAGYSSCLGGQRGALAAWVSPSAAAEPEAEWDRAVRYCESLHGDDRGGANTCRTRQQRGISQRRAPYSIDRARSCESLYGDNRAGYWACAVRQR
jgi:hypothetical protein